VHVAAIALVIAIVLGAAGCADDEMLKRPRAEASASREPAHRKVGDAVPWRTDFTKQAVPLGEFFPAAPKDAVPPIDRPTFVGVTIADRWLERRAPVLELEIGAEARAYPLQILVYHEVVNDTVGGRPVVVTFCGLCNTTLVFERRSDGRLLDFGTTGKLRNSNLVMYDRQTESWWQQFGGEAVVGELAGRKLRQLPAAIVAWGRFKDDYPRGRVLSSNDDLPYGLTPYPGYDGGPVIFPTANLDDDRLLAKERVVFMESASDAVAVPFSDVQKRRRIELEFGGRSLEVTWEPGARSTTDEKFMAASREIGSVDVRFRGTGKRAAFTVPFWFAVAAFRPDVRVLAPPRHERGV
jgi:hypothetical protein